jgi:hypothetical protein
MSTSAKACTTIAICMRTSSSMCVDICIPHTHTHLHSHTHRPRSTFRRTTCAGNTQKDRINCHRGAGHVSHTHTYIQSDPEARSSRSVHLEYSKRLNQVPSRRKLCFTYIHIHTYIQTDPEARSIAQRALATLKKIESSVIEAKTMLHIHKHTYKQTNRS